MLEAFNKVVALDPLAQLYIFWLHGVIVLAVCFGLIIFLRARVGDAPSFGPHPPYHVAITSIFSLFLAFHASEIWTNKNKAFENYYFMTSLYRTFATATKVGPLQNIRPLLKTYIEATVEEEWRRDKNTRRSPTAVQALEDIQAYVVDPKNNVPGPLGSLANDLLADIRKARATTLSIAADGGGELWLVTLFVMGFVSHVVIALIHLDRPRAGIIALTLFAIATTASYWSLGVEANPYRAETHFDVSDWPKFVQ